MMHGAAPTSQPAAAAAAPADCDVVVVGGGGSGLAAAVRAAELGLSVTVLERRRRPGGTTAMAIGSFTAAGTSFQRRQGIRDTSIDHITDAGRFAPADIEARNNTALRALLIREAPATLRWLRQLGVPFVGPSAEPPNRQPRMHNVVPNANAYLAVLQRRLRARGGRLVCGVRVTNLLRDGRRVTGVETLSPAGRTRWHARCAVVLAAGDYAGAPDLLAQHKGSGYRLVPGINRQARGDGHRLAERAGARLVNMDVTYGPELRFVPPPSRRWLARAAARRPLRTVAATLGARLPRAARLYLARRLLVTWQHPEDALFADGAVLVNRRGERFCDESRSPARELAIAAQPGGEAFLLLDRSLARRYNRWPHFISTAPQIAYAFVSDYRRMRPDLCTRERTVEQTARRAGLPATALAATVRAAGVGPGPWLLLGPARAYFTTTEGGAAVDHDMRVLDRSGATIDGLYAVGQNGLGGQILWGHGLHIAWALTSGRLAAAAIAHGANVMADTGGNTDANAYTDANAHTAADAHTDANTDADADTDTDTRR